MCNAMGASRLAKKIPILTLWECIFELFLLKKAPAISQWKITTSETIYTYAEDYLQEAFSKIPVQC